MNEGTYNNVVRSNSPFSPMTPSTPGTYKANVNRTKTRKWVEAKVQNYDGDDWGNEYEDEYDYEEPEPEPEPQPSRVAALRQQAIPSQQSRAFSQPSTIPESNQAGPSGMRSPSGPPSLHIQTGGDSKSRLPSATSSMPSQSRFPPRESSATRQGTFGPSDTGAPGSNPRLGSGPSSQTWPAQRAASPTKPAGFVRPADIYSRIGEEREKDRRSTELGRPSVEGGAPVEQRKNEQSSTQNAALGGTELGQGRANQSRLSTSPKLPDLARMSGFGDDFFSPPGGNGPPARSGLSSVLDSQRAGDAGARPGSLAGSGGGPRGSIGFSGGKQPSSTLEGPKLEPNPRIIMPPVGDDLDPKKEDAAGTSQQPTQTRPQLPGTWVSETVNADSEGPTAAGKVEGPESASLGSTGNTDVSPINKRHAEPADLEPTTTVKQLPSIHGNSEAAAKEDARKSDENGFNSPTGKHDDTVASKVIAAGPGYHPTRQSLPPLKTDNPLAASNAAQKHEQPPDGTDMAPPSSNFKDSPSQLSFTQQSAVTTGSGFTPTAPLNPRRSIAAPADLTTPVVQERKSTMSTVDTASPEKESDKLREEIIKSLSASPSTTPDASVILGTSNASSDPTPGALTRESTYLSGVYDDYLTPIEEKSLQETGQILKKGPTVPVYGTGEAETSSGPIAEENSFPDIAPLSPHRSPKQESAHLPKRFSWEAGPEKGKQGATQIKQNPSTPPHDTTNAPAAATIPSGLQPQPESNQVPGAQPLTMPDPISPASLISDRSPRSPTATREVSRLSFADEKEKVLIQSSPDTTTEHPALANPIEMLPAPSPTTQPIPTGRPGSQAKVMAFRDILNIVSIEQRIQKFDETRTQFYSMESGLSNWIAYMKNQPEHGGAAIPIDGQPVLAQGQASQPGVQSSTQQPYYQQYLNASSPAVQPAQPGRSSTGNLQHMFTGQPTSSFGSSNQVGAKSKEFLQAAGAFGNKGMKSGMKLFNKGKNKLRGDKAFF
ncbi:uncharacterized protein F4822DRAFT_106633 [Hypoxylon trugodes]|uniref:uncharacterized protein n=1 Tax=Hypoxylon trugodes TaxID=326681 RepID=UPI0021914945|nr:uncharacterized protein F4822DRAFT_106633 [Hypoxylon trugodes]KAI1391833.1 hypothetical protein F4822DRAFT_106633 [Hypoxylon trugodes]